MRFKPFFQLLAQAFHEWSDDKASRLGAALAYYMVFAIAPLLVIAIGIAGIIFGEAAAKGLVAKQLQDAVGPGGAEAVQEMIRHTRQAGTGIIATVVGSVTLLFGAAGGFWQLQDALNTVWKVAPRPGRGILGVVRDRIMSFLLVLGIGLVLLASLAATTALAAVSKYIPIPEFPGGVSVWQLANGLVSLLTITVLFAIIYKVLPDVKITWRDVWAGAALAALLFTIGKQLIGLYLGYAGLPSAFGAAGSLVLILFWIYYSAQIFLFGAEFSRAYALRYGLKIEPTSNAMFVTNEEMARQGMPRSADLERRGRERHPAE